MNGPIWFAMFNNFSSLGAFFWITALAVLLAHAAWISWVDQRKMIIPDRANFSLGTFGLLWTWYSGQSPGWQIIQAATGGFLVCLVGLAYSQVRKQQGLGLGDVKFAFAATTWVGLSGLPWLVLVASLSALVAVVSSQLAGRPLEQAARIPFGPHLCIGLLATWLALSYDFM